MCLHTGKPVYRRSVRPRGFRARYSIRRQALHIARMPRTAAVFSSLSRASASDRRWWSGSSAWIRAGIAVLKIESSPSTADRAALKSRRRFFCNVTVADRCSPAACRWNSHRHLEQHFWRRDSIPVVGECPPYAFAIDSSRLAWFSLRPTNPIFNAYLTRAAR